MWPARKINNKSRLTADRGILSHINVHLIIHLYFCGFIKFANNIEMIQHATQEDQKKSSELDLDVRDYLKQVRQNKIDVQELDMNNDIAVIKVPVELLVANARALPEDIIEKSTYYTIKTI